MKKLESWELPEYWADKPLVYIEPHYDDFLLNAYSLLRAIKGKKAMIRPSNLTIITFSHSPANYQNGLRAILGKYSTEKINIIELGLPDFVNDKENKQLFEKHFHKTIPEADTAELVDFYILRYKETRLSLAVKFITKYYQDSTFLIPLAVDYSHPFHRIVSDVVYSAVGINEMGITPWWYVDNPYCYLNDPAFLNDQELVGYCWELSKNDLAIRYSLFVNNYEHQVTSQVIWYNSWMLECNKEIFLAAAEL